MLICEMQHGMLCLEAYKAFSLERALTLVAVAALEDMRMVNVNLSLQAIGNEMCCVSMLAILMLAKMTNEEDVHADCDVCLEFTLNSVTSRWLANGWFQTLQSAHGPAQHWELADVAVPLSRRLVLSVAGCSRCAVFCTRLPDRAVYSKTCKTGGAGRRHRQQLRQIFGKFDLLIPQPHVLCRMRSTFGWRISSWRCRVARKPTIKKCAAYRQSTDSFSLLS